MEPPEKRRKKKDKARDTFDKYGKFTSKHVRMSATFSEKEVNAQRK